MYPVNYGVPSVVVAPSVFCMMFTYAPYEDLSTEDDPALLRVLLNEDTPGLVIDQESGSDDGSEQLCEDELGRLMFPDMISQGDESDGGSESCGQLQCEEHASQVTGDRDDDILHENCILDNLSNMRSSFTVWSEPVLTQEREHDTHAPPSKQRRQGEASSRPSLGSVIWSLFILILQTCCASSVVAISTDTTMMEVIKSHIPQTDPLSSTGVMNSKLVTPIQTSTLPKEVERAEFGLMDMQANSSMSDRIVNHVLVHNPCELVQRMEHLERTPSEHWNQQKVGTALVQNTIVADVTEADADTADDVVVIMVETDETYADAAEAAAVILSKATTINTVADNSIDIVTSANAAADAVESAPS